MDKTLVASTFRSDGFVGQRMCVLPGPDVERASQAPLTRRLLVTDAGFFPHADRHRRARPGGASQAIVMVSTHGRGWVQIDGQRLAVEPRSCVRIPPGTPHAYEADRADPWSIWWLHVRGSDVADLLGTPVAVVQPVHSVEAIVALWDDLLTGLERGLSPAHLARASGIAWHLLTELNADAALPPRGSIVERAMQFQRTRLDTRLGTEDLAALVGVSPSHLRALYRQATGGSPTAHHTSLRMARARELLDTTDELVSQIGMAVGYDDPLYFSKQFRRLHHVSPRTYRANRKLRG